MPNELSYEVSLERSNQIRADLPQHPEKYTMLTGDRPTGRLHLGHYFGSIREPIDVPYLLGVQTDSFDWLIGNERWQKRVEEDLANGTNTVPHTSGLDEVFQEISPIENFAQTMSLTFSDPYFEEPRHTVQECKEKDYTYSAPLYVNAEFENGDTGEIKSQTVFMGDFPLQTPHGTFIIGGTERVIVSQLVRVLRPLPGPYLR